MSACIERLEPGDLLGSLRDAAVLRVCIPDQQNGLDATKSGVPSDFSGQKNVMEKIPQGLTSRCMAQKASQTTPFQVIFWPRPSKAAFVGILDSIL